jgi:hypothetical protein
MILFFSKLLFTVIKKTKNIQENFFRNPINERINGGPPHFFDALDGKNKIRKNQYIIM